MNLFPLMKNIFLIIFLSISVQFVNAQDSTFINLDYNQPQEYTLAGVTVSGTKFLDQNALITLSGLVVGDKIKIPGDKIAKAINNLWKQGLFEDIEINITKILGSNIFLDMYLQERPRLSKFQFNGIKKGEVDEIKDKIKLSQGKVVNENLIKNTINSIKKYYQEKGFLNATVAITQKPDTALSNSVLLIINIAKKSKVKIHQIEITGNKSVEAKKLKKSMKDTKERKFYNVFKTSKFQPQTFEEDKVKLLETYSNLGFRDAYIVKDTVYKYNEKTVKIEIEIAEGSKYYFGNISWVGNTKYSSEALTTILGIKKGDIYNAQELETRLQQNPNGRDVSSLYLDDGYLFFNVSPFETRVYQDTIDLEIRIAEGAQATINKVTIEGNQKTNDKVVLREIRTKPGQKFSRADIIRTTREIAQLGYFDDQKTNVIPKPNPTDGTVDLQYIVEEKPSDQIELSGGFGAGTVVGTLGLSFNNFSLRNIFNGKAYSPIPTGDGQRLSLRAQANGRSFQSYSFSFTEPWFGGKKPISFGTSIYRSQQSNNRRIKDVLSSYIIVTGVGVTLGKRLKKPDDFFVLNSGINFQQYQLKDYQSAVFNNGTAYNISLTQSISRNSVDAPIYPKSGSNIQLSLQVTPPYSFINGNVYDENSNPEERFKFIEYHKWKFDASQFIRVYGNLVLNLKTQFGFVGLYNRGIGISPFEKFRLGGDGLTGFNFLTGSEIIGLRGYENNSVVPEPTQDQDGSPIFNKYVMELRHPITQSQSSTIFLLAFAEAGNTWNTFNRFQPFNVKRSIGVGVRIFLPIFGLLGLDYGYGFDAIPGNETANKGQFHFSIAQSLGGF